MLEVMIESPLSPRLIGRGGHHLTLARGATLTPFPSSTGLGFRGLGGDPVSTFG